MTIRVKLASAFTLGVAVILAVVGVVTYQLLRQSLLAEIERDVADRAATFAAAGSSRPYQLDVFGAPDVFLQVVDAGGSPIARSANLGERTLPLPTGARNGDVVEVHVGGRPLFLTAAALDSGGHIIVARSPVTTYRALRALRTLLAAVTGGAVLMTALASWWYARTVLRPIDRVVDAARAVRRSRDLTQRVSHRGPADEVGRLVATFNDMLADLADLYASLDRSNQHMRQFLADCSHELRTPLARIRSTVDMLQRADDTDTAFRSQALTDMAAETDRMARMVRQLLILARADAGATIEPRTTHLDHVLEAAFRQAERMASGHTLTLPDPGTLTGVTVHGDADHLTQLILILLDNAFKYTPPPGEISVKASHDGRNAYIAVADTGLGVPPEDTERIFERFYRGRNTAATTGTGLGLAIAKWIVEQHGGRIELIASANGTRLHLTLPLMPGTP